MTNIRNFMAGFYLIGEAAEFASRTMLSWPMLFVAGDLLDRIML